MVGLRGVGKTVLLDRMRDDAEGTEIQTLRVEAPEGRSLPAMPVSVRRPGRRPHHQLHFHLLHARHALAAQPREHALGGEPADLGHRQPHGGERGGEFRGEVDVVVARDGQRAGHGNPARGGLQVVRSVRMRLPGLRECLRRLGCALRSALIGTASVRGNPFDVFVAAVFGIVGYILRRTGFPLAPVVIGLVLGPLLEDNLRRGLLLTKGGFVAFFTHSWIAALLFAITAALLLAPYAISRLSRPAAAR